MQDFKPCPSISSSSLKNTGECLLIIFKVDLVAMETESGQDSSADLTQDSFLLLANIIRVILFSYS